MVAVNIDARQLNRMLPVLEKIKDGVKRVVPPSINRALNKGRTEIRREIRKNYIIKQKDIPMRVVGANMAKLGGAIILKQGMIDTGKFRVQPRFRTVRRRPLIVQVRTRGGGGLIPRGFMTNLRYAGPYERVGEGRFPIRKLLTIGAPIMATQQNVGPIANKAIGDTLAKELDRNFKRIMASAGGHS